MLVNNAVLRLDEKIDVTGIRDNKVTVKTEKIKTDSIGEVSYDYALAGSGRGRSRKVGSARCVKSVNQACIRKAGAETRTKADSLLEIHKSKYCCQLSL